MARTPQEEAARADRRDKRGKTLRKLRRLRADVRAWVANPPANNAQRDRMLADLANAVLALNQRVNLIEGGDAVDVDDLADPGV
jgi:hypothetical protein